jgi:hypothetical protein
MGVNVLRKAMIRDTVLVSIKPFEGATPQNCLNNVNNYIAEYGGEVQLGWIFSILGNIAIKLTSHAVLKKLNGELICVTPNPSRKNKIRFSLDQDIENLIVNNHLPVRFIPLIDSTLLEKYLDLEREIDHLRVSGGGLVPQIKLQQIQLSAQVLYPDILTLAKKNTSKTDYCFCGSNKRRAKCCN